MGYRIRCILICATAFIWPWPIYGWYSNCGGYSRGNCSEESYYLYDTGDYLNWGTDSLSQSGGLRNTEGGDQRTNSKVSEKSGYNGLNICRISKYISYQESVNSKVASKFGINNTPNDRQLLIMRNAGINFFDPLRSHFNKPIHITSFFRSPGLNKKVGGSTTSHHMILGDVCAIDIDQDGSSGPSNLEVFNYIKNNLDFHILIWEFGTTSPQWVHVAYSINKEDNKKKYVYKASKVNNLTIYTRI